MPLTYTVCTFILACLLAWHQWTDDSVCVCVWVFKTAWFRVCVCWGGVKCAMSFDKPFISPYEELSAGSPLDACWCKNNHAGCFEAPGWPLYGWSEDNYRTHDLWIFIKPRPRLDSFERIHYRMARQTDRQPASQAAGPFPSPTAATDGSQGQAEAGVGQQL